MLLNKIIYRYSRPGVYFVLGGPGSGKGTQCTLLAQKYKFIHLSAGELLRAERDAGSKNGQLIEDCILTGKIVPSLITVELLGYQFNNILKMHTYLIDGFPRNVENLDKWNDKLGDKVNLKGIINIDCDEKTLTDRVTSRAKLGGRSDDNEVTLVKRFKTHNEQTHGVVQIFRALQMEFAVDGQGSKEEVLQRIQKCLNLTI